MSDGYGYEGNDWSSYSDGPIGGSGPEPSIECPECKVKLRKHVLTCPKCGAKVQDPPPTTWMDYVGGAIGIFMCLLFLLGIFRCLADAVMEVLS